MLMSYKKAQVDKKVGSICINYIISYMCVHVFSCYLYMTLSVTHVPNNCPYIVSRFEEKSVLN